MNDVILSALIGAIAGIVVSLIQQGGQKKKDAVSNAVRETRLDTRLSSIETKLDIHNGYAEKLGDIQTDIAVIKNDIKTLYRRGE